MCAKEPARVHGFNAENNISNRPPSRRYEQKHDGLVCAKPNYPIMANISLQVGPFELSIFALKLCAVAGSFARKQPCDFQNLVFSL
jgi:hypothetical protein